MKILLFVMTLLLTFVLTAFGQATLPGPEMGAGILEMLSKLNDGLGGHLGGIVGTVLGIVLMLLSKVVSTDKSSGFIDKVQKVFDFLAKLLSGLGALAKKLADILAEAVKSDGFLGKK